LNIFNIPEIPRGPGGFVAGSFDGSLSRRDDRQSSKGPQSGVESAAFSKDVCADQFDVEDGFATKIVDVDLRDLSKTPTPLISAGDVFGSGTR
jgi:hypothetical protein